MHDAKVKGILGWSWRLLSAKSRKVADCPVGERAANTKGKPQEYEDEMIHS